MKSPFYAAVVMLAFALPAQAVDLTPPLVVPNVSGTIGQNGWFVSDVALTWTVVDDESSLLATTGCEPFVLTQDDTKRTITCVATSEGGTTVGTYVVGRDTAGPLISYLGNTGSYSVAQTITIDCRVVDVTSGVASTDCTDIVVSAASLGAGTFTYGSTATDFAGNTSTASASFTVVVDTAGISALIDQYVTKESVARSLKKKFEAGQIDQFIRQVDRETGRSISLADAITLKRLVLGL